MRKPMLASALALIIPASAIAATDPAPPAAPQGEAQAVAPAPAPADQKAAIGAKIRTDWAKYDAGAKGHLLRPELAKWLADLRVAAGQPAPDAEWQKSAFVQTDTNRDSKVSVEELVAFLTSGA